MCKIEKIYEEDIKSNMIHKDNRVIRVKQLHKQGKEAKLLNNFLYQEAQLKIGFDKLTDKGLKYKTLNSYDTILTVKEIRKILGLEKNNNYVELIQIAINQLKEEVVIYNYRDNDGKFWESMKMRFITFEGVAKEATGERTYTLGISEHMYKIIKETKSNYFTELNLDIHKKLTSNGIELYEYLKSYQNMNNGYCPPLNLEKLNNLFFTEYKYISKMKTLLMNNLKKINEKTDLIVREVIKENGKKGEIYLQVQENKEYKKERFKKEQSIANQKLGQKKQVYKMEKIEEENNIIEKLLNKAIL